MAVMAIKAFETDGDTQKFWPSLSTKGKVHIALGIFLTLMAVAILSDVTRETHPPLWIFFLKTIVFAVGSSLLFIINLHSKRLFLGGLILFLGLLYLINQLPFEEIPTDLIFFRIRAQAFLALLGIFAGYSFFINFIVREGTKKVKLKTEIQLAREIHKVLVPYISFKNSLVEIEGISTPVGEMGGDMIDVDVDEKSQRVACIVADVSGHGISAGLVMASFKSILRTLLPREASLGRLISETNRVIYPLKKKDMFVTAAAIQVKGNNEAEFLVAGHLPILHLDSETKTIGHLRTRQVAPGLLADYSYQSEKVVYKSGDIFVLLTDGVVETMNQKGEPLGFEPVQDALLEYMDAPLPEMLKGVLKVAAAFGQPHDDQTLLVMKCR